MVDIATGGPDGRASPVHHPPGGESPRFPGNSDGWTVKVLFFFKK